MPTTYRIDWPKLIRFNNRKARQIATLAVAEARIVARRNVLYRKYPGVPPRPLGLANSIYGVVRSNPNGTFSGRVGSRLRYAMSVEEGAAPHVIRPRNPNGYLYFYWVKVGDWVAFKKVNHPGQKGKRYLANALIRVGRRRGFKVFMHS